MNSFGFPQAQDPPIFMPRMPHASVAHVNHHNFSLSQKYSCKCSSSYLCETCFKKKLCEMFPVRNYEKLSQTTSRAYVECPPINLMPQASVASVHDTHFAINILPHSLPPKHYAGELVNAFAGEQARSCYSCGRTDRCGCGGNEDSFDRNSCDSPLETVEDLEINLQEDDQQPDIDGQDQDDDSFDSNNSDSPLENMVDIELNLQEDDH